MITPARQPNRPKSNMTARCGHAVAPCQAQPIRYEIDTCEPFLRAAAEGKLQYHALSHGHYPGDNIAANFLPGLASLGYWDALGPQDWGLDPHRNEGVEIVYLETGRLDFVVDGHKFRIPPGSVTVTRPWQLHCLGDPHVGPSRMHWLLLDVGVREVSQSWQWPPWVFLAPADLRELTRKLRGNGRPVWTATPEIRQVFGELAGCVRDIRHTAHAASRMSLQINRLLLGLLDMLDSHEPASPSPAMLRRHTVEQFLDACVNAPSVLAKPWTLESMARHCGLGPTMLVRYCRQITNQSPMDYLNGCRLEFAAKRLRAERGTTVARIAAETGFASSQYFATRFRQRFGRSPQSSRGR